MGPLALDTDLWPDIETVIPRVVPADGNLDQQYLQAAFADLATRVNAVLQAGDGSEELLPLVHPGVVQSLSEAACRAALDATIAQANQLGFQGPVDRVPDAPFPIYQSNAVVSYPTGDAAGAFAASVIGDGQFHLVLSC